MDLVERVVEIIISALIIFAMIPVFIKIGAEMDLLNLLWEALRLLW